MMYLDVVGPDVPDLHIDDVLHVSYKTIPKGTFLAIQVVAVEPKGVDERIKPIIVNFIRRYYDSDRDGKEVAVLNEFQHNGCTVQVLKRPTRMFVRRIRGSAFDIIGNNRLNSFETTAIKQAKSYSAKAPPGQGKATSRRKAFNILAIAASSGLHPFDEDVEEDPDVSAAADSQIGNAEDEYVSDDEEYVSDDEEYVSDDEEYVDESQQPEDVDVSGDDEYEDEPATVPLPDDIPDIVDERDEGEAVEDIGDADGEYDIVQPQQTNITFSTFLQSSNEMGLNELVGKAEFIARAVPKYRDEVEDEIVEIYAKEHPVHKRIINALFSDIPETANKYDRIKMMRDIFPRRTIFVKQPKQGLEEYVNPQVIHYADAYFIRVINNDDEKRTLMTDDIPESTFEYLFPEAFVLDKKSQKYIQQQKAKGASDAELRDTINKIKIQHLVNNNLFKEMMPNMRRHLEHAKMSTRQTPRLFSLTSRLAGYQHIFREGGEICVEDNDYMKYTRRIKLLENEALTPAQRKLMVAAKKHSTRRSRMQPIVPIKIQDEETIRRRQQSYDTAMGYLQSIPARAERDDLSMFFKSMASHKFLIPPRNIITDSLEFEHLINLKDGSQRHRDTINYFRKSMITYIRSLLKIENPKNTIDDVMRGAELPEVFIESPKEYTAEELIQSVVERYRGIYENFKKDVDERVLGDLGKLAKYLVRSYIRQLDDAMTDIFISSRRHLQYERAGDIGEIDDQIIDVATLLSVWRRKYVPANSSTISSIFIPRGLESMIQYQKQHADNRVARIRARRYAAIPPNRLRIKHMKKEDKIEIAFAYIENAYAYGTSDLEKLLRSMTKVHDERFVYQASKTDKHPLDTLKDMMAKYEFDEKLYEELLDYVLGSTNVYENIARRVPREYRKHLKALRGMRVASEYVPDTIMITRDRNVLANFLELGNKSVEEIVEELGALVPKYQRPADLPVDKHIQRIVMQYGNFRNKDGNPIEITKEQAEQFLWNTLYDSYIYGVRHILRVFASDISDISDVKYDEILYAKSADGKNITIEDRRVRYNAYLHIHRERIRELVALDDNEWGNNELYKKRSAMPHRVLFSPMESETFVRNFIRNNIELVKTRIITSGAAALSAFNAALPHDDEYSGLDNLQISYTVRQVRDYIYRHLYFHINQMMIHRYSQNMNLIRDGDRHAELSLVDAVKNELRQALEYNGDEEQFLDVNFGPDLIPKQEAELPDRPEIPVDEYAVMVADFVNNTEGDSVLEIYTNLANYVHILEQLEVKNANAKRRLRHESEEEEDLDGNYVASMVHNGTISFSKFFEYNIDQLNPEYLLGVNDDAMRTRIKDFIGIRNYQRAYDLAYMVYTLANPTKRQIMYREPAMQEKFDEMYYDIARSIAPVNQRVSPPLPSLNATDLLLHYDDEGKYTKFSLVANPDKNVYDPNFIIDLPDGRQIVASTGFEIGTTNILTLPSTGEPILTRVGEVVDGVEQEIFTENITYKDKVGKHQYKHRVLYGDEGDLIHKSRYVVENGRPVQYIKVKTHVKLEELKIDPKTLVKDYPVDTLEGTLPRLYTAKLGRAYDWADRTIFDFYVRLIDELVPLSTIEQIYIKRYVQMPLEKIDMIEKLLRDTKYAEFRKIISPLYIPVYNDPVLDYMYDVIYADDAIKLNVIHPIIRDGQYDIDEETREVKNYEHEYAVNLYPGVEIHFEQNYSSHAISGFGAIQRDGGDVFKVGTWYYFDDNQMIKSIVDYDTMKFTMYRHDDVRINELQPSINIIRVEDWFKEILVDRDETYVKIAGQDRLKITSVKYATGASATYSYTQEDFTETTSITVDEYIITMRKTRAISSNQITRVNVVIENSDRQIIRQENYIFEPLSITITNVEGDGAATRFVVPRFGRVNVEADAVEEWADDAQQHNAAASAIDDADDDELDRWIAEMKAKEGEGAGGGGVA